MVSLYHKKCRSIGSPLEDTSCGLVYILHSRFCSQFNALSLPFSLLQYLWACVCLPVVSLSLPTVRVATATISWCNLLLPALSLSLSFSPLPLLWDSVWSEMYLLAHGKRESSTTTRSSHSSSMCMHIYLSLSLFLCVYVCLCMDVIWLTWLPSQHSSTLFHSSYSPIFTFTTSTVESIPKETWPS